MVMSDDRSFVFASELTALALHPAVPRDVDPEALQKFFAYGFIPAPRTLLNQVKKLPAGHWMKVPVQGLRCMVRKYWEFELDPFETIPQNPERAWGEELVQRLDEAVRCRLQADVPVGVFLSGGIDSTTIATLAARHHPAIETFSIGFEEKSFDEREFARLGAETAKTRHHEEVLTPERYLKWALPTRYSFRSRTAAGFPYQYGPRFQAEADAPRPQLSKAILAARMDGSARSSGDRRTFRFQAGSGRTLRRSDCRLEPSLSKKQRRPHNRILCSTLSSG
jgi:Asparagine synthase